MIDHKLVELNFRHSEMRAIRDGVGDGLVEVGRDPSVLVFDGDLAESTRAAKFAEMYPDRFFQVGVAEQNLAGVAAGAAHEGFVSYISSYAVFSPGRNWEQIRVSIAMSRQNVKIIGSHGGVATGLNGPSHQAIEDIATMRVMPNMTVLVPADARQCAAAIKAAHLYPGPVYIRTARPATPNFTKEGVFEIGKIYRYRSGRELVIAACGIQVYDALMLADKLAVAGYEAEVLNVSTIKPLDSQYLRNTVAKIPKIVTIEDHRVSGGLGSAVAEVVAQHGLGKLLRIGIGDKFGISGEFPAIYEKFGLDQKSLFKAVIDWLNE